MSHHDTSSRSLLEPPPWGAAASGDDPGGGGTDGGQFLDLESDLDDTFKVREWERGGAPAPEQTCAVVCKWWGFGW